jgi:hypothetical protein
LAHGASQIYINTHFCSSTTHQITMPPVRHKDNKRNGKIRSDTKNRNFKKKSNPDEPGVQKVKSALRQTRRLLAKVRSFQGYYEATST